MKFSPIVGPQVRTFVRTLNLSGNIWLYIVIIGYRDENRGDVRGDMSDMDKDMDNNEQMSDASPTEWEVTAPAMDGKLISYRRLESWHFIAI